MCKIILPVGVGGARNLLPVGEGGAEELLVVQSFQKSALLARHQVNGFAKDLSVLLHQCSRRNHCLNRQFQHHQYTVKGGLGQKATV